MLTKTVPRLQICPMSDGLPVCKFRGARDSQCCVKPMRRYHQLATLDFQLQDSLPVLETCPHVSSITQDHEFQGLVHHGQIDRALDVLLRLDEQGTVPSIDSYRSLLKACSRSKALAHAKQLHVHLANHGLHDSRFLGEYVVSTLVKCGGLDDAIQLFQKLSHRTAFSWTAVISGYTRAGLGYDALRMYKSMREQGLEPNKYTFVSLIKACSTVADLKEGKHIHAEAVRYSWQFDLFVGTALVDMYGKCGSIVDAQNVFDGLAHRDVALWNAMLAAWTQQGRADKAWQLYGEMRAEDISPDARTFVSALQACGMLAEREQGASIHGQSIKTKSLLNGKAIHAEAWRQGYQVDVFVGNTLVSMYGRCGSIDDAEDVFHQLSHKTVVSWNVMVTAYTQLDLPDKALQVYEQMLEEGLDQNSRTFLSALQACVMLVEREEGALVDGRLLRVKSLQQGKAIHAEAWKKGYESDNFISSSLISIYGRCGSIIDAQDVFDWLSQQDVVSWNALLTTYLQNEQALKTLQLYEQILEQGVSPDIGSFVIALQACCMLVEEDDYVLDWQSAKARCLNKGKAIHAGAWSKGYQSDALFSNTLINTYGKCGSILDSEKAFKELLEPDIVSWNAMLAAYIHQGLFEKTVQLYVHMQEEGISADSRTLVSMLQACSELAEEEEDVIVDSQSTKVKSLQMGKLVNAHAWEKGYILDVFLANTLISLYGKCGSIKDAITIFHCLPQRTVVTWTGMIESYLHQGQAKKSLQLYVKLLEEGLSPNNRTFMSVLRACGLLGEKEQDGFAEGHIKKVKNLEMGKAVQAYAWKEGYKSDENIGNVLITMFGKCGSIMDARNVFDGLSQRSVVSWNAMLAAYTQQGQAERALQLLEKMRDEGVSPNEITLLCVLQACSKSGSLAFCRQIHRSLLSVGDLLNPLLANTLIHAYGRCASMRDAQSVFDALSQPNVISWSALIAGYAREGNVMTSLQLYDEMQQSGTKPNGITFLSLLSACSHGGLVDKGIEYFESMSKIHSIMPESAHYVTMIDLLARAGYFTNVEEIIRTMPMQPDFSMWLCLLSACRKHEKLVLGKYAFDAAVSLHPTDASAYVLMSNMYAHAGQWDRVKEVKLLRQKAAAWEKPGQSWIAHEQDVHTFVAGDCNHAQKKDLYTVLGELTQMMNGEGQIIYLTERNILGGSTACDRDANCI